MHSEKPYALHPVCQTFLQRHLWNSFNVRLIDDGPLSSFQGRSSSTFSFNASLLQVINGVMSLALCPQVVSQASQHFRSSEKQATCEGCFARQSTVHHSLSDSIRQMSTWHQLWTRMPAIQAKVHQAKGQKLSQSGQSEVLDSGVNVVKCDCGGNCCVHYNTGIKDNLISDKGCTTLRWE